MRWLFSAVILGLAVAGFAQTICIDPGHPSEVGMGTQGKKVTEVQIAWEIAGQFAVALKKEGYTVVLTKGAERTMVRNRRRAEIANAAKADLMVRLHCDAASGSGFTVYYPDQQGTSNGVSGPSDAVISASRRAATKFQLAMAEVLMGKLASNGLKNDRATAVGGKQGALTGSIFSKVPVLLVEMVVLTNPKDERFIISAKGKGEMVKGLVAGVKAALNSRLND